MIHPIDQYQTAVKKLAEYNNGEKDLNKLVEDIKDSYNKRIEDLKTEMSDRLHKAETQRDISTKSLKECSAPYQDTIKKVKRILKFMDLLHEDNTLTTPAVYIFSSGYPSRKVSVSSVGTLLSDEYNILNMYIVPNKNRVNMFSLIIRGYSIFSNMGITEEGSSYTIRQDYIHGVHDEGCNIGINVKEAPTEKELLTYVKDYIGRIKNNIHGVCLDSVKEYEDAKEMFKDPRWQLFYWEHKKEYYEEGVSRGTDDPEYPKILKRIRDLRNGINRL